MSSYPNTDPFAQNPYVQNPYKAVGGPTFVGGPTNAILGMQKPFSYPNNNPRRVPGSSPGGAMGPPLNSGVTMSMDTSIPTTRYGSPLPFNPLTHNFAAHYMASGGLAAQALGASGGGMGAGAGGGGGGWGRGNGTGGGVSGSMGNHFNQKWNPTGGDYGHGGWGPVTVNADPSKFAGNQKPNANPDMGSAQNWHDLNPNGPQAFGPTGSGPNSWDQGPQDPSYNNPFWRRVGVSPIGRPATPQEEAMLPQAAYGGTVMHRAIVGDPQADGGPNPELVEAYGPIRVTPLKNMPRRQAHASWARLPHCDQGGTTDGDSDDSFDDGSDNDSYSGDEGNSDNDGANDADDGTSDAVPPAPDSFNNQPAPNDRPLGQSLGSDPESVWAQAAVGEGNSRPVGLPPDGDWPAYHPGDRPPGVGLDEGSGIVGAATDALSDSPPAIYGASKAPSTATVPPAPPAASAAQGGYNPKRTHPPGSPYSQEIPPSNFDRETFNSIYDNSETARALYNYARSKGFDLYVLSPGGVAKYNGGQAIATESPFLHSIAVDTLGDKPSGNKFDWTHATAPFHEMVHIVQLGIQEDKLNHTQTVPPELRKMIDAVSYPDEPSGPDADYQARRVQNNIINEYIWNTKHRDPEQSEDERLTDFGTQKLPVQTLYGHDYPSLRNVPRLERPFPTAPTSSPASPPNHP